MHVHVLLPLGDQLIEPGFLGEGRVGVLACSVHEEELQTLRLYGSEDSETPTLKRY